MLVVFVLVAIGMCSCKNDKSITVYDVDGNNVTDIEWEYDFSNKDMAYCDIALSESVDILSKKLELSETKAKKLIYDDGYKIYTYYDKTAQEALIETCEKNSEQFSCSAAVTDLEGKLVAAYGYSKERNIEMNMALHAVPPYSTIKPLSVYSQAFERKLIHWSSVYEDSAYKHVINSNGEERPWPSNASGQYSGQPVTVYEGLKKSLNTVAVKCLSKVGVDESIEFLEKNFAISLFQEKYLSTLNGEEDVIGNISMGYLQEGFTPVELAGYYQIFANGGLYEKPSAVYKICDSEDNIIYEREYSPKQVISVETADIMNKMMQGVIKTGGTGFEAYTEGIEIAGKTGTGDNVNDSWFVGVTPEYSCAVWHGENYINVTSELYSNIIEKIYAKNQALEKAFNIKTQLEQKVFCEESGKLISPTCTLIQVGYYFPGTDVGVCEGH